MSEAAPVVLTDEESGREYYQYPSGMTKWKDTGLFRTPQTVTPIARDPRGNLAKRNEKSRQIAREAIDEAAGLDPSQWGTGEGWRIVIKHYTQTFLKSSNVRGMGEGLSKLAIVSGYATREDTEKGPRVHIDNVNVGFAEMVASMLAAKGQPATEENVNSARQNIIDGHLSLLQAIEDDHRAHAFTEPEPEETSWQKP